MTTPKFTPGPWEVVNTRAQLFGNGYHGGLCVVSRGKNSLRPTPYYGNGYLIAESIESEECGAVASEEVPEAEATAYLIAAAPDLYAALQQLDTAISGTVFVCESGAEQAAKNATVVSDRINAACFIARAALAKATGGTQ